MPPEDLYSTLGVERNATDEEIRQGYRRAARDAHPDRAGGTEEKMKAVNKAYEVLSNTARRSKYDSTGNTGTEQTPQDGARKLLSDIFEQFIDAGEFNLINETHIVLTNLQTDGNKELIKCDSMIRRLTKRRKKIRRNGTGENLAHMVIDRKLQLLNGKKSNVENTLAQVKRARELLIEYEDDESGEQESEDGIQVIRGMINTGRKL